VALGDELGATSVMYQPGQGWFPPIFAAILTEVAVATTCSAIVIGLTGGLAQARRSADKLFVFCVVLAILLSAIFVAVGTVMLRSRSSKR
jgi:hypothetical protein